MRPGTVFQGRLPYSPEPWRFAVFDDRLVCTNPRHEPVVIELVKPNFIVVAKEPSPWAIST